MSTSCTTATTTRLDATSGGNHHHHHHHRRSFIGHSVAGLLAGAAGIVSFRPSLAVAASDAAATTAAGSSSSIPMISSAQFDILLRNSARSVKQVEFSGPKSETVTVRLMDGTAFGIKDVIESSVDPRSPLKIAATCRENLVPTKFVDFEAALAAAPKKKKLYANERVLEAAEKEREKKARMQQDEEDRIAALFQMEQEAAGRK
jgi:hypothetical protein